MAGSHSKSSSITTRIAQIIRSRKFRRENRSVLAVLALVVVVAVAAVLMQHGLAKRYTVRVLDCHYIGNVAHKHNQDCYDEDGNLVCPLRERELHTHNEDCYDAQGNLICGKEELTEEHVHGDGCFVTIASASADNPTTASTAGEVTNPEQAENPTPAMTFSHTFVDAEDKPVLAVEVDAPEGALPKDTTMEATWVTPFDVNKDDVQKAVSAVTAGKVLDLQAVDITFYDGAHNEIEPQKDVIVTFTSDMLANTKEEARVVHIESDAEAAERGKDAEPQSEVVKTIPQGALGDDQVAFESAQFSQYVIALVSSDVTVTATGDLADGSTVTIDAPAGAGLSQDAAINATQYATGEDVYETLVKEAAEAAGVEGASYAKAYDIKLIDGGEEVQPQAPVLTSISVNDLPKDKAFAVAHYDWDTQSAEIVESWVDGNAVFFEAKSFSPYVIIEVDQDQDPAADAGTGDLHILTTLVAAEGELNLQDFIDQITFTVQSRGKESDGTSYSNSTFLEIEENSVKTTSLTGLPEGSYTVGFELSDTDEYNIDVVFDPADGKVDVTDGGSAVIRATITVGMKPAEPVVGGIIDIKINKEWQTAGGQSMSWPPDAEPLVEIRRMKSTNEGRTWTEDTTYEDSIYLNHTGTTTLYGLYVEDPDVPGLIYKYYVYETQIANGYTATIKIGNNEIATYGKNDAVPISDLQKAGFYNNATVNLVNTFTGVGDNIDLTVQKQWVDSTGSQITPPAGTQAEFTLHRAVSTDGGATYTEDTNYEGPTKTVSTSDETFTDLPIMNASGSEIYKYYALESDIPFGWRPTYVSKAGNEASVKDLVNSVATDQTRTQVVKNQRAATVDVPVLKSWPDFDPNVHSGATWSASFVLERAEIPEGGNPTDFEVMDANDIRQLTHDGSLTFEDLPTYRYDAEGKAYRQVYSVKEVAYNAQRPANGDSPAKSTSWNGSGDSEYYQVFVQDAGDPEVDFSNNNERWYRIILSNIESNLEEPSQTIKINLAKDWQTTATPDSASFELVRYVQESYRDWSGVSDPAMADTASWAPAQLTFGGNTSTTIDLPDGAPAYVVVTFKAGPGHDRAKFTYTDLDGNEQTVTVNRQGAGNETSEVFSSAILAQASGGVRSITVSEGADHIDSVRLSDVSPSTNSAVRDRVVDELSLTSQADAANRTGKFTTTDASGKSTEEFPITQAEPMSGKHQTVYNYSYYVRETSSTPRSTSTITVGGETHDIDHRIDVSNGSSATVNVVNKDMPNFEVVKNWVDTVNSESRYPTVFFTLYQLKRTDVQSGNGAVVYKHPDMDDDAFVDIPLSQDNNFRWICPVALPTTNARGEEVVYFVREKVVGDSSSKKTYIEPAPSSETYRPEVLNYAAYSGRDKFATQMSADGGQYTHKTNDAPTQPYRAYIFPTDLKNHGENEIAGEIEIINKPPTTKQMDMLKKKWFDWKPDGSLDAGENFNLRDCVVQYQIYRRAFYESNGEYNTARRNPTYSGPALAKDWHQWYIDIYQGFDDNGNDYSSVDRRIFTDWYHAGLWNWTFNGQGGRGLEARGFEMINGELKEVAYQYVFVEVGLWQYDEVENPITHEMVPTFYKPFRDQYEYYAVLPVAWDAQGDQVELFPRIVAQDQDRITNLIASNLVIEKAWPTSEDLSDVEEIYLKVYRGKRNQQGGIEGNPIDVSNIARDEAQTILTNTGMVSRDRYVEIPAGSDDWYIRLTKNEASLTLRNLPLGTSVNEIFKYWVEEKGWKGTDGQIHMDTSRFQPTYAAWNPSTSSWDADSSTARDAAIGGKNGLGPKGENRILVDNTPTKKVKVLKRWQDENGADTTAWKNEITYKVERQARRYSNVGTQDEPRFVQDVWYTNDDGQTWLTRAEFNELADQTGYVAASYGANVGGTFTPSAWERLTFNGNETLTVKSAPTKYIVKATGAGAPSYTVTTGTIDTAADGEPTYTDASGATVTASSWYDVIDGLADSISVDEDGDGKIDYEYKYTYRVTEATPADAGSCVTYEPSNGSLAGGQATIINAKNSLRVLKRWYDADNNEIEEPWDSNLQVKFTVRAIAQDWVFNAATNTWKEDGDPRDAGLVTGTDKLEIKQANQIVTATLDNSDPNHATYTFSAADAPTGMKIGNREKWAMRIDGLETEFKDPNNDHKKTTFSYEVVEDAIDGAITTYSPHPAGNDNAGRVTNGRNVEIRNRKNPVEITAEKVFAGLTEADLFEADANDPSIKHVKAPLSGIRLKLENTTTPLPIGVTSGVIFDDTIGALYDGGLLTYEVDANDPTKITLRTTVSSGSSFPNYSGTLHLDAIVTGADYKLSESGVDANVPTGYQYSTSGARTEQTKNVDTDGTSGSLTLQLANPYKKVIITAKKDFEGIDIADFIETDDSTTPPTEHIKAPLADISLKLVNQSKSKTIFEDTIGNLFDGGVITYAYDANAKKLTFSTQISTDSEFPNYNGTIDKSGLVGGDTYKLTEGGASTHVPSGYQFRAADATGEDSGAPAASGNDEGKLTLALANPYNEIKIHVEKKFTGLDDIFDGVTNAKIVDDYDNLDAGVKKVLEGVKLSLKNTTKSTATTEVYVFQNKSLKELIQSGVLTYDGQSVKVAGDITKASAGINLDALVGGCEYELTESGADLAASIPDGYVFIAGESKTSDKKTLDATTAQLSVDCENKYIPTIDVKVYKVPENAGATGPDTAASPLEGATFVLEKGEFVTDQNSGKTTWNKTGEIAVVETSTKGIFDITGLEAGTYKLIENDVPDGYIKYDFAPIFNVVYNQQTKMLELNEVTTDPVTSKDIAKASEVVVDTASNEVRLYVSNPPGEELPHSGGPGTIAMTLAGIALIASASLYLLKAHLKVGTGIHKIG